MVACKVAPKSSVTVVSSVTIPVVEESAVTDADDSIIINFVLFLEICNFKFMHVIGNPNWSGGIGCSNDTGEDVKFKCDMFNDQPSAILFTDVNI